MAECRGFEVWGPFLKTVGCLPQVAFVQTIKGLPSIAVDWCNMMGLPPHLNVRFLLAPIEDIYFLPTWPASFCLWGEPYRWGGIVPGPHCSHVGLALVSDDVSWVVSWVVSQLWPGYGWEDTISLAQGD